VIRRDLRIFAISECCQEESGHFAPHTDDQKQSNKNKGFMNLAGGALCPPMAQVLLR
jgi:hypothetical protein